MKKVHKISQDFQRWLLALVAIAFLTSTAFLWVSQTRLSETNTNNLLQLNLSDVEQDIKDLSDDNLLKVTRRIARELNKKDTVSSFDLMVLADKHSVPEINLVDINGIISKLDYLKELGIKTIYFNPIFEAYSNHKYDTGNYMKIDDMFGGEKAFSVLLEKDYAYVAGGNVYFDTSKLQDYYVFSSGIEKEQLQINQYKAEIEELKKKLVGG